MGCRTLIGVAEPDGRYTARWLHYGDAPAALIPVLRRIWTATFAADTRALAGELLARDWVQLDPRPTRRRHDPPPRPGVGHPMRDDLGARHGHIATDEVDADLEWLYLLDRAADAVSVYEATRHGRWLHHSTHPLTDGR